MAFGWDDLAVAGIGALSSYYSAKSSQQGVESMNAANLQIARENRDWQERMSNTAHTREVADLRNAGLNPILSATGGSGASSPGGSTAVMQNPNEQSSNIISNSAKQMAEILLNRAGARKLNAEGSAAEAEAKIANAGLPEKIKAAKINAAVQEKMALWDQIGRRIGTVSDAIRQWIPGTTARSLSATNSNIEKWRK